VARHYFDEQINTPSEYAEDGSLYSAFSTRSEWFVIIPIHDFGTDNVYREEPEPDEL